MHKNIPHSATRRARSAGFTLVEMLVSVAIVLLMMTMFAEIFTLATSSMSKQKGLAELDQRQRMVATLLRDDLKNRSFRTIYPFHQNEPGTIPNLPINIPFSERQGYFYISENSPDNDTDDVLQFTITRSPNSPPFYGRTRELLDAGGTGVRDNPNQPENDDGSFYGEGQGVGTSRSAEVSYFLRNGILYRRILLIRQPSVSNYTDEPSAGPGTTGSVSLIQSGIYPKGAGAGTIYVSGANLGNRYPQDFDYSAINDLMAIPQLTILGESKSLSPTDPLSLGRPNNRFGFQRARSDTEFGFPKEYVDAVGGTKFIGRFTHEETSHTDFAWPGNPGYGADGDIGTNDDTNPYTRTDLSTNPNGTVANFANGPRQGEDILLTNVQSFDVKVWDPGASVGPDGESGIANGSPTLVRAELGTPGSDDGAFVDIGYGPSIDPDGATQTGKGFFFSQFSNRNPVFGPRQGNINSCFDTWNVSTAAGPSPLKNGPFLAPFRPALPGPDGQPGVDGVDDDGNGTTDDASELGWPDSDDIPIVLTAIQIRVRFLDISSGLVREITVVQALK